MGDLDVTLQPGQWRAGPGEQPGGVSPGQHEVLQVQLIRRTIAPVLDEVDWPTGWVGAQAWWRRPAEPAPDLLVLLIRAEALPPGLLS